MHRIIPLVLVLLALSGCRTNEDNYRRAYERAKEREAEKTALDDTIYGDIRKDAQTRHISVGQQMYDVRIERMSLSDGQQLSPTPVLQNYNIVVAQFKQRFHANSLASRLRDNGYPGAFVIQTAEPLYYVVALNTADSAEAVAALRQLAARSPVRLNDGFPILLSAL